MDKYPYIQFYTGDWLKDPALSICAPATRGVWMDLLCAMHEAGRSGQLRGTTEQLARISRCSAAELTHALTELQATGAADVNDRNGTVTVSNRRMRRDAELREKATERQRRHRSKDPPVTKPSRKCHGNVTSEYDSDSEVESDLIKIPNALLTEEFIGVWNEWISVRRSHRWSVKKECLRRQLESLQSLGASLAVECINHSIQNGYQGIFADKFCRRNGREKPKAPERVELK